MGFADLLAPIPEPETPLGRLRILSPTCGLRVNRFTLGGMSLGEAWSDYVPPLDQEASSALLDAWYQAGGICIDTSNHYQDEQSETYIGNWIASKGIRDHLVISTKFTSSFRGYKHGKNITANIAGNSRKSLHVSLTESLRKLQTTYVDILYVHFWDHTTSIEELMDSLDHFVKSGQVLYLGASNLPAWLVAGCNSYAKASGKTPFVIYQGKWSVLERDLERDILPMCRAYNMAIAPWAALGQGRLQSPEQLALINSQGGIRALGKGSEQSDMEVKMSLVLAEIASRHHIAGVQAIALAWLHSKYDYCYPVIGMNNKEQMESNIAALGVRLDEDDIARIDAVNPWYIGYPNNFNGDDPNVTGKATGVPGVQVGTIDWGICTSAY